jgi:phage gp45-like
MNNANNFHDAVPFIMEGQVLSTADPDQMGRCRVWVPSLDGENFNIDQLPWAEYASPFMGFTVAYPAGAGDSSNASHTAYGFWAIPKVGSTVLVFCLNADPSSRMFFASTVRLHRNRSLPAGRNKDNNGNIGPFGDAIDSSGNQIPIQPAYNNIRTQFQNKLSSSEAQTRGVNERQVAQAKTNKDGTEGYSTNPADPSYLDPQTYCIVTPGRNAIIMQDDPRNSRLRFKTAEGHQIILDDTNERIYISTAKGSSWFEMDQDGHVSVFGADSISIRSGVDINLFADNNVNIEAGNAVNVKSDKGDISLFAAKNYQVKSNGNINMSACGIFDIGTESSLKLTGTTDIDIFAGQNMAISGMNALDFKTGGPMKFLSPRIDLRGVGARTAAQATCATLATSPSVVPGFEPWTRPMSTQKRGKNWKP